MDNQLLEEVFKNKMHVVITGDIAFMEILKDKNYVRASTLGIVISKF